MSIVEFTGPSNPQEIRKYLMRRTKDQIVWEYLRLWREYGDLEKELDALEARVESMTAAACEEGAGPKMRAAIDEEPKTILARLKVQWCEDKAAHFMELADNARANGYMAQADAVEDMAQELKDDANKLRRQAEGGE